MAHPLASELAPQIHRDVEELHQIVARWVVTAKSQQERAKYRVFGSGLRELQNRIAVRGTPPTQEEIEIALTVLLVLAGRRAHPEPG
jgi:hypothetical protein